MTCVDIYACCGHTPRQDYDWCWLCPVRFSAGAGGSGAGAGSVQYILTVCFCGLSGLQAQRLNLLSNFNAQPDRTLLSSAWSISAHWLPRRNCHAASQRGPAAQGGGVK